MAYFKGEGVSKNEDEGLYWINQAAKNGYYQAKTFLEKTPHSAIIRESLNPLNYRYLFSLAFLADVSDVYLWWIIILGATITVFPLIAIPLTIIILWSFITGS